MGEKASIARLLQDMRAHYRAHGRRGLPWRHTRDPYRILVSEVMLQQTQVERVVPYYRKFIKTFPTARSLARAKLGRVLALWQGLGYNRRAKHLWEAAKRISSAPALRSGEMNTTPTPARRAGAPQGLPENLPGVGPYTQGAVAAFAFNQPAAFIETNIRTVFFHHLYKGPSSGRVSDAELLPLVAEALERSRMEPREFYWALMDYGSHLKKQGVRLNMHSAHYTKQKKFEGSARQLRGAILRELLKRPATLAQLTKNLSRMSGEVRRELIRLRSEELVTQQGSRYSVGR